MLFAHRRRRSRTAQRAPLRLAAVALAAGCFGDAALATKLLPPGGSIAGVGIDGGPGGQFELTASDPTLVGVTADGEDLFAVELTITNTLVGADTLNPFGVGNENNAPAAFGENGSLHHDWAEAVFGGPITTPTADVFPSTVDSHFLAPILTSLIAPAEAAPGGSLLPSGVASHVPEGASGLTGFGAPLTGAFGINDPPASVDLVRLVAASSSLFGPGIDFSFVVSDADVGTEGELFRGVLAAPPVTPHDPIEDGPEPAASLLGLLAIAIRASHPRRRRRRRLG